MRNKQYNPFWNKLYSFLTSFRSTLFMVRSTCLLRLIMIAFLSTELCIFTVKTQLTGRWALNKGRFLTDFGKFSCFHFYAGRTFFNIFGTKLWQLIQTSSDILLNIILLEIACTIRKWEVCCTFLKQLVLT